MVHTHININNITANNQRIIISEGNWRHLKRGAVPNQVYREKLIQPYLIVMVWRRMHNANLWNRLLHAMKNCPKEYLQNSNIDGDNIESEDSDEEEEIGNPEEATVFEDGEDVVDSADSAPELTQEEVLGNERRLKRAESQVMRIMCSRRKSGIFSIKSANKTGVYVVRIKNIPTCTCRDFEKEWICKHLKAVLLNAYSVPLHSPLLAKRVFSTDDLQNLNINVTLCEKHLDEHDIGKIVSVGTY